MENLTLSMRPYQEKDFERIAQIHDEARKNELALADLSAAFIPLSIAAEKEGLFEYELYVAEYDSDVVGFIAFTRDEIAWLYADVHIPRKGIGKALLRFALENVNDDVTIEVLAGNTPAIALYTSFGFEIAETVSGRMPGNETFPVTVHVMKKSVSSPNSQSKRDSQE